MLSVWRLPPHSKPIISVRTAWKNGIVPAAASPFFQRLAWHVSTYRRKAYKQNNSIETSLSAYKKFTPLKLLCFMSQRVCLWLLTERNVSILSLVRFVGCFWFHDHEIPRKECTLHSESSGTLKWLPSYHVVYFWNMASLRALFWVPCYSRYTSNLFLALSISAGVTITDTLTTLSSIIAVFSCHPRTECCATISG